MAGADIRYYTRDRQRGRASVLAGMIAAVFVSFASVLIHPLLVVVVLVATYADNLIIVGLVSTIAALGWVLPTLISSPLRQLSRQQPWLLGTGLLRVAILVVIAFILNRAETLSDDQILLAVLVSYGAFVVTNALAVQLATGVASRALTSHRKLAFFPSRTLWGSVFAIGAGFIVYAVLGEEGADAVGGFALLFITAATAMIIATYFEFQIREPARAASRVAPSLPGRSFQNGAFRRFTLYRLLLGVAALADPFLVVYAVRELSIDLSLLGWYIVILVIAITLVHLVWSRIAQRFGARLGLQAVALVRLVIPLVALLIPILGETGLWRDRITDERAIGWVFGSVFALIGIALAGQAHLAHTYLMAITPPDRPTAFILPTNLVTAVASLAPLLGGWLVMRQGYDQTFLIAAIVGFVAVLASGALSEAAPSPRPLAGAWRLRRARP